MSMIQCPSCKNTLPDWAQKCQFCGADVTKVPRPKAAPQQKAYRTAGSGYANKNLIWGLYYFFAVWWIIDGGLTLATAKGSVLEIVIGSIQALVGVGLLLRIDFLRGVFNVLAFLGLLGALRGLIFAILGSAFFGLSGFLLVLFMVFKICLYGAQIWVLGETD